MAKKQNVKADVKQQQQPKSVQQDPKPQKMEENKKEKENGQNKKQKEKGKDRKRQGKMGKKTVRKMVDEDDGFNEEDLKREIKLLGGSADDLELLYETATDSTSNQGEDKLMADLKAFINQAGLKGGLGSAIIQDDEDDDEEDGDAEEENGVGDVEEAADENHEKEDPEEKEEQEEEEKPKKGQKDHKPKKDQKNQKEQKVAEKEKEKEKDAKLKEQLKKLIDNPEIDEDALEGEKELEQGGELSNVAEKAKKIFITPQASWWELSNTEKSERKPRTEALERQTKRAEDLMKKHAAMFEKKRQISKSEVEWIESVLKNGTLTDKVAALTLLVQESPLYRLAPLESLVAMSTKKGKRECTAAVDSLKDLFINDLLPDRKLIYFNERPLEKQVSDQLLLAWYYESKLKTHYLNFISALEALTHETVLFVKYKALSVIFSLLSSKSEQEKNLLALIVNKLGDTEKKLASKASYTLTQLLVQHPKMKMVVAKEIEQLLFRANVSLKAQYYAVIFLNQTILTNNETEVSAKLIDIYFSMYRLLASKGEVDNKMLSALLTGINRAFPFAKGASSTNFDEHANLLFKVVHESSFNASVQSLALLYQISTVKKEITNRFYRTLYEVLLDVRLLTSSKHTLFLNILFKALKAESSMPRLKAFLKRILQICTYHQPHFVCGVLFMLAEVFKFHPALSTFLSQPEDIEEHFEDVKDDSEEVSAPQAYHSDSEDDEETKKKPVASNSAKATRPDGLVDGVSQATHYDAKKRDPQYCGAELSCLWEIMPYLDHFHPSVATFAQAILKGENVVYMGNPLQDFILIKFLDKFVYRNPKKEAKTKGSSIMQPLPSSRVQEKPVNSRNLSKVPVSKIESDEVFFHRFFTEKQKRLASKPSKQKLEAENTFSVGDFDDRSDESGEEEDEESGEEEKKPKKAKGKKEAEKGEKEGDSDSDAIYENMPSDSDAEDAEVAVDDDDMDPEEEKRLEKMLLQDITNEDLGDDDFDDGDEGDDDDDDDDDVDAVSAEEEGQEVDDDADMDDDDEDDEDEDEDEDGQALFDDDDDDEPFPFGGDEEDEDDDEEGEGKEDGESGDKDGDSEDDDKPKSKSSLKRKRKQEEKIVFGGSTFASAEEFSHLLEGSGSSKSAGKQDMWDRRASAFDHRSKRRKTGGGKGDNKARGQFGGPKGKPQHHRSGKKGGKPGGRGKGK